MIASAQTLRKYQPLTPFKEREVFAGMTFGLGPAGYDIRVAQSHRLNPGDFLLGSSIEEFMMPDNMLGVVHDKSTWARRGLCVQNTVIEPGWKGFLTLEFSNHSQWELIFLETGMPIAQVIFHMLDKPTDIPYKGKYQNQKEGPQQAIFEANRNNGLICPVCRKPQFDSPSGVTCKNDHGGEVGIPPLEGELGTN